MNFFKWIKSPGYAQGVTWALLIAFISVSNDIIAKFIGSRLDSLEVAFFRFFFSMVTVLPFMFRTGVSSFKTKRPDLHFWRAMVGAAAIYLFIYGLTLLPLAEVTVFSFTQPLFFMPLAILFLREKVSSTRWMAVILGFIGILIMIQPGTTHFNIAVLIPMLAAFLFAVSDVLNKKMVLNEDTLTLLFYFALGTTLVAFIPALYVWQTPTWGELFWLLLYGAGANLIQVCIFRAFSATDASSLAPFRYVEFAFAVPLGLLFFGEFPTLAVFIGAAIIIGSTLHMSLSEFKKQKR